MSSILVGDLLEEKQIDLDLSILAGHRGIRRARSAEVQERRRWLSRAANGHRLAVAEISGRARDTFGTG